MDHLCASEGFPEQGGCHVRRRAHDIGEHCQRWRPCLHMGAHKQSWVHSPNEVVQQGHLELRGARSASPSAAIWQTMPTVRTCICAAPSCIPMYRPGAALASKSLCMPAAGGPLGGHAQRGGSGGFGPGLPLRSAGGTRPVCGPAIRQAVGEPGPVPRPVCPGPLAAGVDIRRLVRAQDNRPGLGCLGPAHQGKRGQDLRQGGRVVCGRLWVLHMPHLPGRHSGSQRGGCRAGTAPMLFQGR